MNTDRDKILSSLIEVVRGLSAEADVETRLRLTLRTAAELTGSETASLLAYDEESLDFYHQFAPWFQHENAADARVPLNGSVAGWAFLNRAPVIVDDVSKDERHTGKAGELAGVAARSILAAPAFSHGKPVGVLEVFNKKTNYTGEDAQVLEILAAVSAAAMRADELERGIRAAREEALELDRLKNDFIAITSHELRTPLGLIIGHSTFLKELIGDDHREQVDAIIRNASRLKEIIESITSVDNYQSGGALIRSRRVSVARIIGDVCASFNEMAQKKNIALKTVLQPGHELWVEVDGGKVAIVLGNLLKNAVAFTNHGGEIVVRGEKFDEYVKVTVKDNGVGIPAADLPRIFDRFFQVEDHLTRKHGGMGLGLSVARATIEMHGGRIWVDSEEGQGSVFSFILPIRFEPPAQTADAPLSE